ncbi:MAG: hypothetical protein K0V04_12905 [Deltaproteobacteria bacterium]|nr:hypothetical protein [Deltaproteobacteria bacterium]
MRTTDVIFALVSASPMLLATACDTEHDSFEAEALGLDDADAPALDRLTETPLQDGEERFGEGVTPLDRLTLPGGTELTFVHLDIAGEASLGMIEKQPAGAVGLADLGLESASPLDIYLALTDAETEVPAPLRALSLDHELGARGWLGEQLDGGAFELTAPPDVAAAACDAGFQSYLTNWQPQVSENYEWGFNEDPDSDSDWYGPTEPLGLGIACSDCSETWWHRDYYNDQFEIWNVDEMKMAVSACSIGWRPSISAGNQTLSHYGPTLRFRYRTEGNVSSGQVYSNDLEEAEEGGRWRWYWGGTPASGDNDYDWTIEIANGRASDRFDIGFVYDHHGW